MMDGTLSIRARMDLLLLPTLGPLLLEGTTLRRTYPLKEAALPSFLKVLVALGKI
jgi:hypothetical protein